MFVSVHFHYTFVSVHDSNQERCTKSLTVYALLFVPLNFSSTCGHFTILLQCLLDQNCTV